MFEIVISVSLYFLALVLLVKGAFEYCDRGHDEIITKP